MDFFHHKKFVCEKDNEKFANYDDLIAHYRHVHHLTILKCDKCGKEFIHEKELDRREHKDIYKKVMNNHQDEINEKNKKFSDNF